MTRLPPYTDEHARTEAVMAIIGRTIRRHLGGKRKPATFDLRGALLSLEAAGKGGTETLPDYPELNSQSADRPSVSAPDEAAAGTPNPTAASHNTAMRGWVDAALHMRPTLQSKAEFGALYMQHMSPEKSLGKVTQKESAALRRNGKTVIQTEAMLNRLGFVPRPQGGQSPDFSPDFLSNVKHPDGTSVYIRRKECAFICGVSLDWFDRAVQGLMDDHKFPQQRDPKGQRRWNRSDVKAWAASPLADDTLARARKALRKTLEKQP